MTTNRAAWIVRWDWGSEASKPNTLLLHILQPRWTPTRVLQHMKSLYLNSEPFLLSERLRFLTEKAWRGLIHMEGPRIIIGIDPILVGSLVHDLRAESPVGGQQIIRFTPAPGIRGRLPEYEIKCLGQPVEKIFRISNTGHVSELSRP